MSKQIKNEVKLENLVMNVSDSVDIIIKTILKVEQVEIPSRTLDGEQYIRRMNRVEFEDLNGNHFVMMLKNSKMTELRNLLQRAKENSQDVQLCRKTESDIQKRRFETRKFELVSKPE